ncbi:hypothetical protein RND71_022168 [Anisodus tanguticus]|uniref:Uncharacterized protein n=1 Tax=Anisodus tanguticus TaxID=243964 RepID=A0AAE1RWJ3_9SOLA|nr:hypothetical protein RND71_022168 [Anisodus tanguticus]
MIDKYFEADGVSVSAILINNSGEPLNKERDVIELNDNVVWVVQLSDLHFSVHHPQRALSFSHIVGPTLSMINPSLVFITGDLTDGKSQDLLTMKQDEEYQKVLDDSEEWLEYQPLENYRALIKAYAMNPLIHFPIYSMPIPLLLAYTMYKTSRAE